MKRRTSLVVALILIGLPVVAVAGFSIALWPRGTAPVPIITANPPPKPPACPDLPERQNVTLPDGAIADVRIVRIGEVILYIPAAWARAYFNTGPGVPSTALSPEVHEVECPGVIHTQNLDQVRSLTLWSGNERTPMPGITRGNVHMIHLVADLFEPTASLRVLHGRVHHLPQLNPVPGLAVYPAIAADNPPKYVAAPGIEDMVRWLAEPPSRRDNDRTFVWQAERLGGQ